MTCDRDNLVNELVRLGNAHTNFMLSKISGETTRESVQNDPEYAYSVIACAVYENVPAMRRSTRRYVGEEFQRLIKSAGCVALASPTWPKAVDALLAVIDEYYSWLGLVTINRTNNAPWYAVKTANPALAARMEELQWLFIRVDADLGLV